MNDIGKKIKAGLSLALIVLMLVCIAGCGEKTPSWQEQYDLGMRYLEEGNYEEAILAFTAAIEIDPLRAESFAGRGDAHSALQNVSAARSDYESALDLKKDMLDVYIKLADIQEQQKDLDGLRDTLQQAVDQGIATPEIYDRLADVLIELGDSDGAAEILRRGAEDTGDTTLLERAQQLEEELASLPPELPEEFFDRVSNGEFWDETYFIPASDLGIGEYEGLIAVGTGGDAENVKNAIQNDPVVSGLIANAAEYGTDGYEFWTSYNGAMIGIYAVEHEYASYIQISYRPESGTGFVFSSQTQKNAGSSSWEYVCGQMENYLFNGSFRMDAFQIVRNDNHNTTTTQWITGSAREELLQGEIVSYNVTEYPDGFLQGYTTYCTCEAGLPAANSQWVDGNGQVCSIKSVLVCPAYPSEDGKIYYSSYGGSAAATPLSLGW